MIKVLFDASVLLHYKETDSSRSGIFFATYNIAKELEKKSNVHLCLWSSVLDLKRLNSLKKDLFPAVEIIYQINPDQMKWYDISDRMYYLWKKNLRRPWFRKPISLISLCYKFFLTIKFKKCLLEQNSWKEKNDFFFEPFGAVPKEMKNNRCCFFLHDTIPLVLSYRGKYEKKNILNQIKDFKENDLFFANSKNTLHDYQKFSNLIQEKNSCITYLAAKENFKKSILTELVQKKYQITSKYVFSLCTVEPRKNLIRAVKNFILFVKKYAINDIVWIMGGASWNSFIDRLREELSNDEDLLKYVNHLGYVEDADLPVLYSNAEWFVYTSQYEGFGLPPLEAMQCGCPVIVSNNSSLPEVVGDAGVLIDWDSDEQHIAAYEKYYFDKKFRDMKAAEGLERAKLFSWKKTVDKMVEVMKGC